MSLIYRAIWQDDRTDLIEQALSTFREWVHEKHGADIHFGPEPSRQGNVTTSLVQVEANGVQAALAELIEDSQTERWMTRQRLLIDATGVQWVWIDVERTSSDVFRRKDVPAPRLVRRLIAEGINGGGFPRVGNISLHTDAYAIRMGDVENQVVTKILDPERSAPIVVYTHKPGSQVADTMNRATTTQEILAGVADVVVLDPSSESEFTRLLGRELAVWGGAVRLYLPGAMDSWRHRYFLPDVVERHPREVGRRISLILASFIPARRAPEPYAEVESLLRGRGSKSPDELLELAYLDIAERDNAIEELHQTRSQLEEQLLNRAIDLEELEDELASAKRNAKYWRSQVLNGAAELPSADVLPETAMSLSEAAQFCQRYLTQVVLPDDALHDLEILDTAPEVSGWSKASWRAFKALAAYVDEASVTKGGFYEWCRNSSHPDVWPCSPKKLSMVEGDFTMKNKKLKALRILPISTEVDPSGVIEMQAHMKIAEGGGTDIPRIYFYDDTKGTTKKIHVGFFGPHRYMENSKT